MKKIMAVSIILMLALMIEVTCAELPAPFEKIKQYAFRLGQKTGDVYYLEFGGKESGNEFSIVFIYNPASDIVAVAALTRETGKSPICVMWDGSKKVYKRVYFTPFGVVMQEITEKEAVDSAYVIMRIAVRLKLIKQEIVI